MVGGVSLAPVGGPAVDVEVASAEVCPLGHVGFAENDGAGIAELLSNKGVAGNCGSDEKL